MQTSLVVNGSFAGSAQTFTLQKVDNAGVKYYQATSPQGDLQGAPTIKVAYNKTKANIVGRTVHITVPIYNSVTKLYDGTVQARIVINSPASTSLSVTENVTQDLLSLFRTSAAPNASNPGLMAAFVACT